MKFRLLLSVAAAALFLQSCCGGSSSESCTKCCSQKMAVAQRLGQIAKRARIPQMQLNYSGPDGAFGAGIHNIYFADTAAHAVIAVNGDDSSSVFQGASLSKVVFSYIVMKMYENGEIDLYKPLCEYTDIDRFANKEYAKMLTAKMVLHHRTGLSNWATNPSSDQWPSSTIEFKFRPDSCFGYSGEGIAFLQRAVECIKGKSIDEIAKEMVFDPLGMTNTAYCWLPCYDTIAVPCFNGQDVNRGTGRHPRSNTAYTIRTNAKEYGRFLDELVWGTSLKPETKELMFTPDARNAVRYADSPRESDSTIFWGYGIGIEQNPTHGKVLWHWGDNGSFKALFMVIPDEHKRFVYFTNSSRGHDIINEVTKAIFGDSNPFTIEQWINL